MNWDRVNTWTTTLYALIHSLRLARAIEFGNLPGLPKSIQEDRSDSIRRLLVRSHAPIHPVVPRDRRQKKSRPGLFDDALFQLQTRNLTEFVLPVELAVFKREREFPDGPVQNLVNVRQIFEPSLVAGNLQSGLEAGRVGSPWIDVFLWKDRVFIGTPSEIWSAEQMLSAVPLTGLDIALSIPDQNVTELVKAAHEFMRRRYGADKAEAWRSRTLARQQILIGVKRFARDAGLGPEALSVIGGLVIVPLEADQLRVQLPPAVVDQFAKRGRAAELDVRLRETTDRLGLSLAPSASIDAAAEAAPILPEWDAVEPVEGQSRAVARILIVASEGRRAREIARQFSQPEWTPEWLGQRRVIIEIETIERNASGPSRRFLSSEHSDDELISSQHEVIVLLADDNDLVRADSSLIKRINGKPGKIRLLAPALPEDVPSEALTGETFPRIFGKILFDAMVDTSVARSPFWSGNARRSLDRRIADMVLGAALLCSGDSPVGRQLKRRHRYQQSLLTFALARGASMDAHAGLASEATWARHGLRGGEQWSSEFVARSHRSAGHRDVSGVVQLRERRAHFEDFAAAVLLQSADRDVAAGGGGDASLPFKLRNELARADLAAGFFPTFKRFKGVALCAEAPTIAAVSAVGATSCTICSIMLRSMAVPAALRS